MRHLAIQGQSLCKTDRVGEFLVISPLEVACPLCLRIWNMLRVTPEKQDRINKARDEIRRGHYEEL